MVLVVDAGRRLGHLVGLDERRFGHRLARQRTEEGSAQALWYTSRRRCLLLSRPPHARRPQRRGRTLPRNPASSLPATIYRCHLERSREISASQTAKLRCVAHLQAVAASNLVGAERDSSTPLRRLPVGWLPRTPCFPARHGLAFTAGYRPRLPDAAAPAPWRCAQGAGWVSVWPEPGSGPPTNSASPRQRPGASRRPGRCPRPRGRGSPWDRYPAGSGRGP
jgi:hypothetical protein